jgi:archaellum biogenesis ATPase FlaH
MSLPNNGSIDSLLNSRHFKDGYTPPPAQKILTIQGNNIGTNGSIVLLSGLPKAGKSTFVNAMIASTMVTGFNREIWGIKLQPTEEKPMVGYFDTESSEWDFYSNLNRIKRMANTEKLSHNFNAFNTRQDGSKENIEMIDHYARNYPSSVIIIDGMLDLITNYNDEKESRIIVEWLKKLTTETNVLVIGVLHTGKKEGHTIGHYGSMLDRYSQSVLEVIRDRENDLFRLSAKYLRSCAGIDEINVQWNGDQYVSIGNFPISSPKKGKGA